MFTYPAPMLPSDIWVLPPLVYLCQAIAEPFPTVLAASSSEYVFSLSFLVSRTEEKARGLQDHPTGTKRALWPRGWCTMRPFRASAHVPPRFVPVPAVASCSSTQFFSICAAPVAWPIAKLLDHLLGVESPHTYKKAELKSFLQFHTSGAEPLRPDEINILGGVLELHNKDVQDLMTPLKVSRGPAWKKMRMFIPFLSLSLSFFLFA